MNESIRCKNCIFWIKSEDVIRNVVGVCARNPEQKDLNTLVSTNIIVYEKYTEEMHWCGEFINKEKPYKDFMQSL